MPMYAGESACAGSTECCSRRRCASGPSSTSWSLASSLWLMATGRERSFAGAWLVTLGKAFAGASVRPCSPLRCGRSSLHHDVSSVTKCDSYDCQRLRKARSSAVSEVDGSAAGLGSGSLKMPSSSS